MTIISYEGSDPREEFTRLLMDLRLSRVVRHLKTKGTLSRNKYNRLNQQLARCSDQATNARRIVEVIYRSGDDKDFQDLIEVVHELDLVSSSTPSSESPPPSSTSSSSSGSSETNRPSSPINRDEHIARYLQDSQYIQDIPIQENPPNLVRRNVRDQGTSTSDIGVLLDERPPSRSTGSTGPVIQDTDVSASPMEVVSNVRRHTAERAEQIQQANQGQGCCMAVRAQFNALRESVWQELLLLFPNSPIWRNICYGFCVIICSIVSVPLGICRGPPARNNAPVRNGRIAN